MVRSTRRRALGAAVVVALVSALWVAAAPRASAGDGSSLALQFRVSPPSSAQQFALLVECDFLGPTGVNDPQSTFPDFTLVGGDGASKEVDIRTTVGPAGCFPTGVSAGTDPYGGAPIPAGWTVTATVDGAAVPVETTGGSTSVNADLWWRSDGGASPPGVASYDNPIECDDCVLELTFTGPEQPPPPPPEPGPGPQPPTDRTFRVSGPDRYGTAGAFAAYWPTGTTSAFVATGLNFPDALAAGPAASVARGPVLLTRPDGLPEATTTQLTRLRPQRIVVAGGTAAIPQAVTDQLAQYGQVVRLAGADRYATAAELSAYAFPNGLPAGGVVVIASGEGFADALAGGALAAIPQQNPLLLVARDRLPDPTAAELARLRPTYILVVGGPNAISDAVAQELAAYGQIARAAGADRYDTAVQLALAVTDDGAASPAYLLVATGLDFPDALVAGAGGWPLLLTRPDTLPDGVRAAITTIDPGSVAIFGGTRAVSEAVHTQIDAALDAAAA